MKALLQKAAATRVGRAMAVGAYGQAIQIGLQLIGVPIMISAWGLRDYGVWVILSAVPGYLVMADFGITSAAANEMSVAVTRGERERAVSLYQATRVFVLLVTGTLFLLAVAATLVGGGAWLAFAQDATGGHAAATFLALAAYGLVAVANGSVQAGFRAADRFAFAGTLFQTIFLVESVLQLGVVALGGGLFAAAVTITTIRILGSVVAALVLRREAAWIACRQGVPSFAELSRLVRPGLALMIVPVANATAMQGSVVALASVVGPAAIPVFTTTRTLTRLPLQFAMIASTASVHRFTIAHAANDDVHKARLALLNIVFTTALLVPAAFAMVAIGPFFLQHWTRGEVDPPKLLLLLLIATMLINAAWTVLANFLLALNEQGSFALPYLALACAAVVAGSAAARLMGVSGMALGVLMLDAGMLAVCLARVRKLGLLDGRLVLREVSAVARHARQSLLRGNGRN